MVCKPNTFAGNKAAVYFAIGCPDTKPVDADYKRLGMCTEKSLSFSWDTEDATGDTSPERTRETIVTYKNVTFSASGITRSDDIQNQKTISRHIKNPSDATANEPIAWVKIVTPLEVTEGCFTFTSWEDSFPEGTATWSLEASSCSEVTVSDPKTTP